jgi:hypothetical protein
VVPFNALLSESVLARLKEKTMAGLEEIQRGGSRPEHEELAHKRYRAQLNWLAEGIPQKPFISIINLFIIYYLLFIIVPDYCCCYVLS